MIVKTDTFRLNTKGNTEIIDITGNVEDIIGKHNLKEGQVLIFIPGSTGGLTTIEYEPGLLEDLPEAYERLAPTGQTYHHDARWGDGNGYAHIRASLTGPSLTIPVSDGRMLLGTWQQIIFIDFDNRSRKRELVVQLSGITG